MSRDQASRLTELRRLGDAALARAVSAGVPDALEEFVFRFRRLLFDETASAGIEPSECDDCISEVLAKIATLLVAGRIQTPRAPARYVVQSFWNRWWTITREGERRRIAYDDALVPAPGDGEWVIAGACSEYSLRASRGADAGDDECSIAPVLERLVSAFEEGVSDEEHMILAALGRHVPQREIAEQLGVSYRAATSRIWRLRERLREAAIRYGESLDLEERREMMHFFRRTFSDDGMKSRSHRSRIARVAERPTDKTGDYRE